MTTLTFPTSKIPPVQDATEMAWNAVAMLAKDFEQAAIDATNPGRCHQLHERVTIVDARTRQPRTFTVVNHHALDISPNSPVELLQARAH